MKEDKTNVHIISYNISNAQTLVQTDLRIRKRRTWIAVVAAVHVQTVSPVSRLF